MFEWLDHSLATGEHVNRNIGNARRLACLAAVTVALAGVSTGCTVKGSAAAQTEAAAATPSATVKEPVDSDGDGLRDEEDLRPTDRNVRTVNDLDADRDGVKNGEDLQPKNPKVQTRDDIDTDKDGVADYKDDFPRDPAYSKDSDGDRVADAVDAFPKDGTRSRDTDGDKVADADDSFPTDPSRSKITLAMENALSAAEDYLAYQAFSRQGLIDQLSSKYGSGFDEGDANWAVSQLSVNWNEQAVKAAKDYLEFQAFSRQGLIDQLSSAYGSQFTVSEATYAVNKIGL